MTILNMDPAEESCLIMCLQSLCLFAYCMVAKMSGFRTVTAQLRHGLCYFPFSKDILWFLSSPFF